MEEWASLEPEFPSYSISSYGQVRNDDSGHILAQSKNNMGYPKVGLYTPDRNRRTMETARLVALAFVPGYSDDRNTPIHLDGNKEHTFADNLAWRPRWFAAKYHAQFRSTMYRIVVPVTELNTGQVFDTSLEAVKTFGVLEVDILLSCHNQSRPVFPTGHRFTTDG